VKIRSLLSGIASGLVVIFLAYAAQVMADDVDTNGSQTMQGSGNSMGSDNNMGSGNVMGSGNSMNNSSPDTATGDDDY
jgi:hypothetical protein